MHSQSLSSLIRGDKPNEVVHSNFLYIGPAEGSFVKGMLWIEDGVSPYTWLYPCASADRNTATSAVSKCIACFICMDWLVADQESRFISLLMTNRTTESYIPH